MSLKTPLYMYFLDPVLAAPTMGCILMCFCVSLIGVITYLHHRSLLGEALSHASYMGVVSSLVLINIFLGDTLSESALVFALFTGAVLSAGLGSFVLWWLEVKRKTPADAALTYVLSAFMGVGILLASVLQRENPRFFKLVEASLFGQIATLTSAHVTLYAGLSLLCILVIAGFFKEIRIVAFDRSYAKLLGIPCTLVDAVCFLSLLLSIIIGMRCVGVILLSGMLIAPVVAARQLTQSLGPLFIYTSCIGAFCGFIGTVLSYESSLRLTLAEGHHVSIPIGPFVVLFATMLALLALFFSPSRGHFFRWLRARLFRWKCLEDHILKVLSAQTITKAGPMSLQAIAKSQQCSLFSAYILTLFLQKKGFLQQDSKGFMLTQSGWERALHLKKLHEKWALYLVSAHGIAFESGQARTHEMESLLSKKEKNP